MSCGVSSRSTSRQQALRNSAVASPVAMAGTVGRRLRHLNLFAAEKFPDHRHFEFERHRETGHFFTGLDDLADDRQIDRRQQVARLAVDESGSAEVHPLSPLRDHGHARLVGHASRERSERSAGAASGRECPLPDSLPSPCTRQSCEPARPAIRVLGLVTESAFPGAFHFSAFLSHE